MTNTTGPAQQRDQPTQLTPTEAAELNELIQAVIDTRWEAGFQDATNIYRMDGKEARDQARAASGLAINAIYKWQSEHGYRFGAELAALEVTP